MENIKYFKLSADVSKFLSASEAIVIENLAFWIKKNISNNKHFHDGYFWTYNTYKSFSESITCFTERQIRTIMTKLTNKGIIMTSNYNKTKYDRTKWYTIIDDRVLKIYNISYDINKNNKTVNPSKIKQRHNMSYPYVKHVAPIPVIKTHFKKTTTNNTNETICQAKTDKKNKKVKKQKNVVVVNLVDLFNEKYNANFSYAKMEILYYKKGVKIIEKCINDFDKYVNNAKSVQGIFYDFCIKYNTPSQYKINTQYKNNLNNNKPIQATNYEQRQYDDAFFDSLYDNVNLSK